ncbi:MAG: DUF2799 domain-containing protein [Acidiferrobacterales bacterium]|nr:DUF2799 domain-containing protein [Acidiferrobacterales bacterium]
MNNRILIPLLSISFLITGCSTMEKTECIASDWQQVGLDDGTRGVAANKAGSYLENCSGSEVAVDMNAYNQGHEKGVALFCQTENGFDLGKKGYEFSVQCPTEFNSEYKIGYQYYIVNSNIAKVENALLTSENNLIKLESNITNAEIQLSSDDLSISEQTALRQNIDSMTSQIDGYEQARVRLEPALHQLRQQLQTLNAQYGR